VHALLSGEELRGVAELGNRALRGHQQVDRILARELTKDDWKLASYNLFLRSQRKYFRSFQQCREKWINHINPSVKKGEWEVEEDIELFRLVISLGCRWALISR
jgi:citrate lyase synthetase